MTAFVGFYQPSHWNGTAIKTVDVLARIIEERRTGPDLVPPRLHSDLMQFFGPILDQFKNVVPKDPLASACNQILGKKMLGDILSNKRPQSSLDLDHVLLDCAFLAEELLDSRPLTQQEIETAKCLKNSFAKLYEMTIVNIDPCGQ